jgi:hypothetical protein
MGLAATAVLFTNAAAAPVEEDKRCGCKSERRRSVRAMDEPRRHRDMQPLALLRRAGSVLSIAVAGTWRMADKARLMASRDEKNSMSAAEHVARSAAASCRDSASSTRCATKGPI